MCRNERNFFIVDTPPIYSYLKSCNFQLQHLLFLSSNIKLILQFSCLKQEQFSCVCSNNNTLLAHPGMTQVILWFHLLEVECLEVALTVAEVLEDTIANHTQLCIVLGIKANLLDENKYGKCPKISYINLSNRIAYANSADPDQTTSEWAVWSSSTLFASKCFVEWMHEKKSI